MKQHYMKMFKVFIDESKDTFIDGLKSHLEGLNFITSLEDGEDEDYNRDLGGYTVSIHVTRGAGISKLRASGKTSMIENLEERMFRLKESIKDIVDFVKEERLRRAEKEKQKKRDEDEAVQVQSQHSAARVVCDDNGIKEALLEVATLKQASINIDEVMIPEVAAVVEKKNLDEEKEKEKNKEVVCEEENKADGSAGVEKKDYDEGRQDEEDTMRKVFVKKKTMKEMERNQKRRMQEK